MPQLASLAELPTREATRLLAAAALKASPAEAIREASLSTAEDPFVGRVLDEVRDRLGLTSEDNTPAAAKAIANFLGTAIVDATLGDRRPDDVLARAGQAGRLPASSYRILWDKGALLRFREFGVHKTTIEKALSQPDEVQHLFQETELDNENTTFSLYTKLMPASRQRPAHWMLVQAVRKGVNQTPTNVWWIYPQLVELSKVTSPLQMLIAFVEEFGRPFEFAGRKHLFLEEAILPKKIGAPAEFQFHTPSSGIPGQDYFDIVWSIRTRPDWDRFKVGLLYVIDRAKYKSGLKSIGAL